MSEEVCATDICQKGKAKKPSRLTMVEVHLEDLVHRVEALEEALQEDSEEDLDPSQYLE